MITRQTDPHRWEGIEVFPYKESGTHFKTITRQTLFAGDHDLPIELRYFEIGPGGHSTLERHEHAHLVMVSRGKGQVLVGDQVSQIGPNDLVQVPPMTWHQFQPLPGETLGIFCVVSAERDRPQRPTDQDVASLNTCAEVADFIKL